MLKLQVYVEDPCTGACFECPDATVECHRDGEHVLLYIYLEKHPRFGKGAQPLEVRIQEDKVDWTALLMSSLALIAMAEDIERLLVQVRIMFDLRRSWLPPRPQHKPAETGEQTVYA